MVDLEFKRYIDNRLLFCFRKYAVPLLGRLVDRRDRFDNRVEGQPVRSNPVNRVQRVLRHYFVFVRLLRRNDNVFGNERAYRRLGIDIVAAQSI